MPARRPTGSALLSETSRGWLLQQARDAIARYFVRRGPILPKTTPHDTETLRGCFVSIHTRQGDLRGCLGAFETEQPLWQHVQDMAVAAATRDPRFVPLTAGELDLCALEISALTPRSPTRPEDVIVGQHGLWVTQGAHRGILLPQVAAVHGWDRETFLEQACLRAGLDTDAWRSKAIDIATFTTEVFTESDRLL